MPVLIYLPRVSCLDNGGFAEESEKGLHGTADVPRPCLLNRAEIALASDDYQFAARKALSTVPATGVYGQSYACAGGYFSGPSRPRVLALRFFKTYLFSLPTMLRFFGSGSRNAFSTSRYVILPLRLTKSSIRYEGALYTS